eukprot:Em0006g380a
MSHSIGCNTGATSSHVSSDWARFSGHEQSPSLKSFSSSESEQSQNQEMITLLMSINGKLSHILLNKPNQFLRRKTQQWSLPRSHVMKRIGSMVLTLIPKRNIYTPMACRCLTSSFQRKNFGNPCFFLL